MLEGLIRFSLARRWLVLGAASAVLALGAQRAADMPVDVFPDLTAPRVTLVTEATGLAAEEVERLITFPIETSVNGVAGVRRVRSASGPGISIVWVEFDWLTTEAVARQRVTERLQGVAALLPPAAEIPSLAPPSSVMGEIAFVALTSEADDPLELRRVAEVEVRRRVLAVRGVSQVVAIGGAERQYQVLLDPALLRHHEVTAAEVVEALRRGNQNAPGGYVVEEGLESVVRVLGRVHTTEELAQMVVALRGGIPVKLGQLAEVRVGGAPPRGTGSYDGEPAVVMSVTKQPGADTIEVTARLDEVLDDLDVALQAQGMTLHRDLFRQADFIDKAVANLLDVLRDGAVLVVIVLAFFLWSFRPTIISALAIPLSLAVAVIVLDLLGMTLDTMTLGGLAIAIGELVDDAIVDVENVTRRLRERLTLAEGERPSVARTVLDASTEIRSSIVSATFVLVLVFLPLLFLEGLEGRLMRPLAVSYLVAIGASLLVAVTITPVLCSFLLPSSIARAGTSEPPFVRWLDRRYAPVVRRVLRMPLTVGAAALALTIAGVVALLGLGRSFLPEFNEGAMTISVVTSPGTSLEQSDTLGRLAEEALLADPAVVSTARRTGRAERDEHLQGVESAEIEVQLRDDPRSKEELFGEIRARLAGVPGVQINLGQPLSHRIEHMVSGQKAMLAIKVVGEDLRALRRAADRVRDVVMRVPGMVDVNVEQVAEIPQIVVDVDDDAAAQYGLSPGEASEAVGVALWGAEAGRIYEQGTATEVVVRFDDEARADLRAVERMRIPTRSGALVPVSAFADVRRDAGPNYVLRENVRRRVVVTANVAGRDLRSAYEEVRAAVHDGVELPEDAHLEYAGQFEREEETGARLLLFGALAILGIALVVSTTLGSARRGLVVLVNLPLALVGGVVGVHVSGGVLSVASMIGFITLFGIATRNGILLATRAVDLQAAGTPVVAAVERAARERLSPILMTAVTAALGLLPLALAAGEPGSEIQAPMATVILFGLVSSTILNMVVVPPLLARFGERSDGRGLPVAGAGGPIV